MATRLKKFLIGIALSVLTVYFLITRIDISGFTSLKSANYRYLVPLVLFSVSGQIVFSLRWYYLLAARVNFRVCLMSYLMGAGGNMVLPARGGDIFRMFFVKNSSGASYPFVLSRLFLEKIMDFLFTVFLGISAISLMGIKSSANNNVVFLLSLGVISVMAAGILVIRFKTIRLIDFLKNIASRFKMKNEFHYKIESSILDLAEFFSLRSIARPGLITVLLWLFFYSGAYMSVAWMLGMDISWSEIAFLMFCGAMGVAVPSAPSGIGIFHASIVSGFLLMGKTAKEGLLYGTVLHLSQFLLFALISLIFYLVWSLQKNDKKEVTDGSH